MTFKSIITIVFLTFVELGLSIRCFECNSANNSMCLEPSLYGAVNVQKYLKTTTCEKSLIVPPKGNQMFCRKMVQTKCY